MLDINQDPSTPPPSDRRSRWVTRVQVALLGVAALLTAMAGYVLMRQPARAQVRAAAPDAARPGFARRQGFGPGPMQEVKILRQFDANRDGRLDAAERRAARGWLATQGFNERRGGGGRSGRFAPASPGPPLSPADVRSYPGAPIYDPMTLRTVFLQFEQADWEPELAAFYNTDVDIPATVTVDGQVYKDVGVHFRGNSSFRMVPAGSKRSLNLAFDFAHDQALGGYRSFNLLNANGDPTFLRTVLYSEIARHYIPIARANFVRVAINGESWGLYVNAEQVNKDFLRTELGTSKGARWKVPGSPRGHGGLDYIGSDVGAYKRIYEIKTQDDPKAWTDLIALCRVLTETPLDKLEAALKPILDIDGVLKFLALEVVLDNSDGYWTRASDYTIYEDPQGRFHILPHDFNEGFAAEEGRGFGGGQGGPELDPLVALTDTGKPLRSRLLAVPALRARYLSIVRDIAGHWLDWKTLGPIVSRYRALIENDVKADTGKLYSFDAFQAGFGDGSAAPAGNTLKGFALRRRAFLLK